MHGYSQPQSVLFSVRAFATTALWSILVLLAMFGSAVAATKQKTTPAHALTSIVSAVRTSVQGNYCSSPYVRVAGPGSGATDPTLGELTIESVNIGEPFTNCSDQSVMFTMQVQTLDPAHTGLATPPPNAQWQIGFQIRDDSGNPQTVWVSMDTAAPGATPLNPEFSWGAGNSAVCTAGALSVCPTISGNITPDGLITIKLIDDTLSFPGFTWTPRKGKTLQSITGKTSLVQTIQTAGPVSGGNSSYTLQGNLSCSTPPIAALSANPTQGGAALNVNFDASASNIPPGGCGTINSYIFDFGDGDVVTQSTPIVSHSYCIAGAYSAVVEVSTTSELTSSNVAQQSITVDPPQVRPGFSIVTSPNYGVGTHNLLSDVACTSASQCWAVGYYINDMGVYRTLIEQWDGISWSIVPSPNSGAFNNSLTGTTCVSTSQCWAVGYYVGINGGYQTLIEQWDGTAWSIIPSPSTETSDTDYLYKVSCSSESQCWAVGYALKSNGYTQTLIEQWDGSAWSIVASPNPGPYNNALIGVTCSSASECWAVGSAYNNNKNATETLVERWDGNSWSIVPSPNNSSTLDQLRSVTCTATSQCWAVGYNIDGSTYRTLIEQWDGTSWATVTSPNASPSDLNLLFDATCASPSECWAVGYDINSVTNAYQTLVEQWDGNSWTVATSPNHRNSFLNNVVCTSVSQCWAVGYYNNGSVFQTLVQEYSLTVPPLKNVISRFAQGSVGTFDIELPLKDEVGIECRSDSLGVGNYKMIFSFLNDLTSVGCVTVTSGIGTVTDGSIGPGANQYTLDLTGVSDQQYLSVTVTDVLDSQSNLGNVAASMAVLVGDTNGDGVVNSADIAQTKSQSGQFVGSSNFREDLTADGNINSADISLVKSKSGTGLP
jgi:hypothetical protein